MVKKQNLDPKVKEHLDRVNKELRDLHEGTYDMAFEKIREAEKDYGKDAFIRAMQYLVMKRPAWNSELSDRLRHNGFSEFDHFDCDWCGSGNGDGLVALRMWRGEDSKDYKMVAYQIPARQKTRFGKTVYELRRPKFSPIGIADITGKILDGEYKEARYVADQFLKAAIELPNRVLRAMQGYVNYSNDRIHEELDDLAKKYGVKQ